MRHTKLTKLSSGLYEIRWASNGGRSVAAIGVTSNGGRWIAPTNWISPGVIEDHKRADGSGISWDDIEEFIPIDIDRSRWFDCAHCDARYPDQECTCDENPPNANKMREKMNWISIKEFMPPITDMGVASTEVLVTNGAIVTTAFYSGGWFQSFSTAAITSGPARLPFVPTHWATIPELPK